jgi:hypothetical protein
MTHDDMAVFRNALLHAWTLGCALDEGGTRAIPGLRRGEFEAFSGAAKDVLLALGLEWDHAKGDYVFGEIRAWRP